MKRARKGFSVVEVFLVLIILGLVAAVFVPASLRIHDKVRFNMIGKNLDVLISDAKGYMIDHNISQVSYDTLVSEKLMKPLVSVKGEKYDGIVIKNGGGSLKLKFPDGSVLERNY